ncbi:substrate-binding domain-containing protein [Paenalcaligenes hominis]|uniref:substrate-binding domain-containing protein n=1 Tax=Paenalcaligenes hominis TaxID=643674 RepID=UPI00352558DA
MDESTKVVVQAQWSIAATSTLDLSALMQLLAALDKVGNLSAAAKLTQLSYRHAWGVIRQAEQVLAVTLIETSRRQGSKLTDFARQLLHQYRLSDQKIRAFLQEQQQVFSAGLHDLYKKQQVLLRLYASHGFAVEGLMRQKPDEQVPSIELNYRTGIEALEALQRGECDVAGFEIPTGHYQAPTLAMYKPLLSQTSLALAFLAQRNVGLFVQADNPLGIHSIADLMRPEVRVVNRQKGSGSRNLMELMISEQGLDADLILNYGATEFTHMAVAAHVASGMADVGFGIETAAQRCGLDFISLAKQRYFFAFHQEMVNSAIIQQFLQRLRSADYHHYMQQLAGYEATGIGTLYTLADAFGDDFDLTTLQHTHDWTHT